MDLTTVSSVLNRARPQIVEVRDLPQQVRRAQRRLKHGPLNGPDSNCRSSTSNENSGSGHNAHALKPTPVSGTR